MTQVPTSSPRTGSKPPSGSARPASSVCRSRSESGLSAGRRSSTSAGPAPASRYRASRQPHATAAATAPARTSPPTRSPDATAAATGPPCPDPTSGTARRNQRSHHPDSADAHASSTARIPHNPCTWDSPGSPGQSSPASPPPDVCRFCSGRAFDGHGMPSWFSPRAMTRSPTPAKYSANIRRTASAAGSSISSTRRRNPSAAFRGFGCGPPSTTRYPYGARPP